MSLIFALSAAASSAFAAGSLDDVAKGLLGEPGVQVALKITPRQQAKAEARLLSSIFRSGLEMARAASKEEATSFKLEFNSIQRLSPEDLTETQRRRVRQIAIQKRVLDALLTSDLALALDLKPEQITRLNAISADRSRAFTKVLPKKQMDSFQAKYSKFAQNAAGESTELADMSDAEFEKLVKATELMSQDMTRLFADMKEKYAPDEAKANTRALRVLTASQRARLRRLQGPKFTG